MGDLAITLFSAIWDGIRSIPFFDFGFDFGVYFLGSFLILVSIAIFKTFFITDVSMTSRIGLNARHKKSKEDIK